MCVRIVSSERSRPVASCESVSPSRSPRNILRSVGVRRFAPSPNEGGCRRRPDTRCYARRLRGRRARAACSTPYGLVASVGRNGETMHPHWRGGASRVPAIHVLHPVASCRFAGWPQHSSAFVSTLRRIVAVRRTRSLYFAEINHPPPQIFVRGVSNMRTFSCYNSCRITGLRTSRDPIQLSCPAGAANTDRARHPME
jgi:hypothetical protein